MHAFFLPFGIYPNNAIVGGSAAIATGAALFKKVNDKQGIVVCNAGDGAMARGPVWEAMNFAAMDQFHTLWESHNGGMPILYNVFNNSYGMGDQTRGETMGYDMLARIGSGISPTQFHAERIDGFNPLAVIDAMERKLKILRAGEGPVMLDTITYRYSGHSTSDQNAYRTKEEIDAWKEVDPIITYRAGLVEAGVAGDSKLDEILAETTERMTMICKAASDPQISPYIDFKADPKVVERLMFSNEKVEKFDDREPEVNMPLAEVPAYAGEPFTVLGGNIPQFTQEDYTTESFEQYGDLDAFNRCTYTMACIGRDLMPTEDRGNIGQVKPSGWVTAKYDFVDGKYLYNRCHLIGYQLTGENANERNLITGTRYFNTEGMLPFENAVAQYVRETGNHVMYRVTPVFEGENLVASGVVMEAESVEDGGEGVRFKVFVHNVQPGVEIDYLTGENREKEFEKTDLSEEKDYVLNKNSKKFHAADCKNANDISEKNKDYFTGAREILIERGFSPCGACKP